MRFALVWILAATATAQVTNSRTGLEYATIQAGIDAAAPGDQLRITSGRYEESLQLHKDVTLLGDASNPPVIDGYYDSIVMTTGRLLSLRVENAYNGDPVIQQRGIVAHGGRIEDCTIRNIHPLYEAVILRGDTVFQNNDVSTQNWIRDSVTAWDDCLVLSNRFSHCDVASAAIVLRDRSQAIGNYVGDCRIDGSGGPISALDESQVLGNVIVNNWSRSVGGIDARGTNRVIANTLIHNTTGSMQRRGIRATSGSVVRNNLVVTDYGGLAGTGQGDHNLFVLTDCKACEPYCNGCSPYEADETVAGPHDVVLITNHASQPVINEVDFTLLVDSPAIDAGDPNGLPTIDFFGRDRIFGAAPDIGATEFVTCSVPCDRNCTAADSSGNDVVDLADLAILLRRFGRPVVAPGGFGDINADGAVDLTDLRLLLDHFGQACR